MKKPQRALRDPGPEEAVRPEPGGRGGPGMLGVSHKSPHDRWAPGCVLVPEVRSVSLKCRATAWLPDAANGAGRGRSQDLLSQ